MGTLIGILIIIAIFAFNCFKMKRGIRYGNVYRG